MPALSTCLANAYDRAMAAVNDEGEADAAARWFANWLARHWAHGPAAPVWPPDAVSVDRSGTLMMRWYTLGQVVLGYASLGSGCYVVPVEELSILG